jgi:hypothetical protein
MQLELGNFLLQCRLWLAVYGVLEYGAKQLGVLQSELRAVSDAMGGFERADS